MDSDLWIFGYGSLLFRPSFAFTEMVVGRVVDFERRFWQASVDHRGVPGAPGRVVTLVSHQGGFCVGAAYRIAPEARDQVLSDLDHRERGGYSRLDLAFEPRDGAAGPKRVTCYAAAEDNPHFVGPESLEATAAVIRSASGPSGHNIEYVIRLAEELDRLEIFDAHVVSLANQLIDPDGVMD